MEHKTHVDTSCELGIDLYRFFPTRAGVLPLVYVDQPPPSSRASALALLTASLTTWPQLFEWAGADTNGLAVASPYVGMGQFQNDGSNQCISVYTAISSPGNKY